MSRFGIQMNPGGQFGVGVLVVGDHFLEGGTLTGIGGGCLRSLAASLTRFSFLGMSTFFLAFFASGGGGSSSFRKMFFMLLKSSSVHPVRRAYTGFSIGMAWMMAWRVTSSLPGHRPSSRRVLRDLASSSDRLSTNSCRSRPTTPAICTSVERTMKDTLVPFSSGGVLAPGARGTEAKVAGPI